MPDMRWERTIATETGARTNCHGLGDTCSWKRLPKEVASVVCCVEFDRLDVLEKRGSQRDPCIGYPVCIMERTLESRTWSKSITVPEAAGKVQ